MQQTNMHFVLYGSLREGEEGFVRLGLVDRIRFKGRCHFKGFLFDLGEYPGVKCDPSGPDVSGDLYEIVDPSVIADMDGFERYDPHNPQPFDRIAKKGSLYIRKVIEVVQEDGGKCQAYIYEYNDETIQGVSRAKLFISGGDWIAYRKAKGA